MLRSHRLLLALALLLAAAALAPAGAWAATYDYRIVEAEHYVIWNATSSAYPARCSSWSKGRGKIAIKLADLRGELEVETVPGYGLLGSVADPDWALLTRALDYRLHPAQDVVGCSPCGPTSEYGECTGPAPDRDAAADCGPVAIRAVALLQVDRGAFTLDVAAPAGDVLRRCRRTPEGTATGPLDPRFASLKLEGGSRHLLRLDVGQRDELGPLVSRGSGCGELANERRKGFHPCTITRAYVVVRRTS